MGRGKHTEPAFNTAHCVSILAQAGGAAIAAALYGTVTTGLWGKLPMTWYAEEFCQVANLTDYRMRPDPATNYPGRTHRFYTGAPVYEFGAGQSKPSSLARFRPVFQYLLKLASGVRVLECGVLTSREA